MLIPEEINNWKLGFARTQRKLANKYNIIFIPKRHFIEVVSEKGASPGLVHLTDYGHELMAAKIKTVLKQVLYN